MISEGIALETETANRLYDGSAYRFANDELSRTQPISIQGRACEREYNSCRYSFLSVKMPLKEQATDDILKVLVSRGIRACPEKSERTDLGW